MDQALLRILVCPLSGKGLVLSPDQTELMCKASRLAYPIRDGIPVMLIERAREMTLEEMDAIQF